MASVVSESHDLLEPARKRQKLSPPPPQPVHAANTFVSKTMSEAQAMAHNLMLAQREREAQAGILCFVNESNPGFCGILKQRYANT
jgi:tRNA pseudouridine13 synthase